MHKTTNKEAARSGRKRSRGALAVVAAEKVPLPRDFTVEQHVFTIKYICNALALFGDHPARMARRLGRAICGPELETKPPAVSVNGLTPPSHQGVAPTLSQQRGRDLTISYSSMRHVASGSQVWGFAVFKSGYGATREAFCRKPGRNLPTGRTTSHTWRY